MRLSRSEMEGALEFVCKVGELDGAEPFTADVLVLLARLVRCEGVSYAELDRIRRRTIFYACSGGGTESKEVREGYWATVREHPIRRHRTRTGALGAFKIYDFLTPRQLRRTQFYGDYLRYSDCPSGFLMSVSLPAPEGTTRTLLVDRESLDFGERERNLLTLLQPHLFNLRRATEVRRRASALVQARPDGLLSERETEVLLCVAEGMRNREIAHALWIAPGTVRKHLDNIYTKLGVHSRAAAALHLREDVDLR